MTHQDVVDDDANRELNNSLNVTLTCPQYRNHALKIPPRGASFQNVCLANK